MPGQFQFDVFLSHSCKDKAVVRALAERLRTEGLRIWFDEWVLKAGDSIPAKIEEGLEHSRVLVLCMSTSAFYSDWAQLESQTFRFRDPLNKNRRFIPLRLDDAPIKGSLAQFLYVNWLPTNQEYSKLVEACCDERRVVLPTIGSVPPRPKSPRVIQTIVGRDAEVRHILNALEEVVHVGAGRVILVRGESGVGKSILVGTVAQQAAQMGFFVAHTVCEPFHEGMSFFPIRELMRQISSVDDLKAQVRAIYGEYSVQSSMADVAELSSIDPVARRDALLGTFANIVFGRAGAGGPLLLVIDDLERTDAGTTDSLLCLLARINDGPVAILGAYRTDVIEANRTAHALTPLISAVGRSGSRALSLHLRTLRETDLPAVVRAILGGDCDLPIQFRHQLWKQTEGNPLFLREVLHALQNCGVGLGPNLVMIDQRWTLRGSLAEWQIPETVEEAIRLRLDLMDEAVRGELEKAAVIGKRFAFEVMCRLSELAEAELLERLEQCIHLALIHESPDGHDSFEFTHGLIREVLYKSMTRIRRKRLHSVVADSLQALRGVVSEHWDALIGEHLYQAGRYSEAAPVLFQAARQLLTVFAAAEASTLLEKSLDAAIRSGADTATIAQIKNTKIQALVAANEYPRARDLARQVCGDRLTNAIDRGWALDYLGDIEWACGQSAAAFEAYHEAEAIAIAHNDTALEVEVMADLAEAYERAAERMAGVDNQQSSAYRETADLYLTRQVSLATPSADASVRSRALRNQAKQLRHAGDVAGAIKKYQDSIALLDPRVASHSVLISYAKTLRFAGCYPDAVAVVQRVLDWSTQSGARRSLGIAYHYRAVLDFDVHGATDNVLEDLKSALSIHGEIGYGRGMWEVQTLIGEWHATRGHRGEAIKAFRSALGLHGDIGDSGVVTTIIDQLAAIDEHNRARSLRDVWETFNG